MLVLEGRNVNDLFIEGVWNLRVHGVPEESRAGPVLVAPYPVMSIYDKPCERVLMDPVRDANPFFHLFESIWMMAGRCDAAFLNRFVKDFGSRFAEDNGMLHGAYGHRWQRHFVDQMEYDPYNTGGDLPRVDQIRYCVEALRKNSKDRRVVITMWDPEVDLGADKRDLPCNTQIYPRVVNGALDLTVMCRSNDIVWGAYGANAVHFSFLQEVMARGIGVNVGKLYQFSNNWHGYVDVMNRQKINEEQSNPYNTPGFCALPVCDDYEIFFDECVAFCNDHDLGAGWQNALFPITALPMLKVHQTYREYGAKKALDHVKEIGAPDWRAACAAWLERRIK